MKAASATFLLLAAVLCCATAIQLSPNLNEIEEEGSSGALQIAVLARSNISFNSWSPSNGDEYELPLSSPGAKHLGIHFASFHLPENATLWIRSHDSRQRAVTDSVGPLTSADNRLSGGYMVRPLLGDTAVLTLSIHDPQAISEVVLHIDSVAHGIKEFGDSGECNVNVACIDSEGWEDQIRSVAMILSGSGSRLCSGAMINNLKDDGRQLFLTANHCLSGSPDDWVLVFNYQSDKCKKGKDGSLKESVHGTKLLANSYYSDYALLEVQEKIPESFEVYLSGWDATGTAPEQVVGIHHPAGDVKKFSKSSKDVDVSDYFSDEGESHLWVHEWKLGTTERGSSGSPLFDATSQAIVGQLHGGEASCTLSVNDYYGWMHQSLNRHETAEERMAEYLDPRSTGAKKCTGRELY